MIRVYSVRIEAHMADITRAAIYCLGGRSTVRMYSGPDVVLTVSTRLRRDELLSGLRKVLAHDGFLTVEQRGETEDDAEPTLTLPNLAGVLPEEVTT